MDSIYQDRRDDIVDSGVACFMVIARFHGIAVDADHLAHQYGVRGEDFTSEQLLCAAKGSGLKARMATVRRDRLKHAALPAIGVARDGAFFILAKADDDTVLVHDPRHRKPEILGDDQFSQRWSGQLLQMQPIEASGRALSRFDFSWFIPAIVKYRRLLTEVVAVSLVLQIIGLVPPLFFQVVMDKVLVHKGFSTLDVIATGLAICFVVETVLSSLRTYVFSHTTNRIDIELGSRLFRQLISLPLTYFHSRRVGDSVARVRELENIRSFLTGNAITVVMDVLFSVVFLAIMMVYSPLLTIIVIVSLPLYFIISLLVTPALRMRLQEKFNKGAENQSFLVESITGIDTLKSMSVEPQTIRRWDAQLAAYVSASFKTSNLSSIAREAVGLIGKVVTVATMWIGAREVIGGNMSVGQLIAFNMLAGRVAQPILRLAQLWSDFQQVGISMRRLGDILDTPTESVEGARSAMPRIQGRITFDSVTFGYRPGTRPVLQDVDLSILPGEIVGIVGRSGSGKSTLTRLVQRLYVPDTGRVLVDGQDLALADLASLRRQIGVVLQENMLFNRSVRENIGLTDPGAPFTEIVAAASLAGAHDFILELPEGYDTIVGEHGANLSGGQRQRIAIARALITDPRILIFDEATSALDYESERIVQANMRDICEGRTVIIIAHRLSAVRDAHRIVVLDQGKVVEAGTHADLVALENGHYAYLHRLQGA